MQSSSTKLLQSAIWAKLQSWLRYINGESGPQYRLNKQPNEFTINQILEYFEAPTERNWQFGILRIIFGDNLEVLEVTTDTFLCQGPFDFLCQGPLKPSAKEKATISYSDPELYKKLFAALDNIIDSARKRHTPPSLSLRDIDLGEF